MAALNKRQQFLFWIVAATVATAGLVAILLFGHRPPAGRHAVYVIGIPEEGATLFFGAKQCAVCHSVNGRGGRVAPDLGTIHPRTPAMGWLTTVLWNHAPGMWRQMRRGTTPRLSQEEMAHILAFLYQAGAMDAAGDPTAGQRVFSAKGCAHCHSVGSSTGKPAPDLASIAALGDSVAWMHAMWNHALSMIEPITRELGEWPEFKGSEMNDLVAYASGGGIPQRPARTNENGLRGSAERGWQVFQMKCIQCHSVRGKGGRIGPELGPDLDLPNTPAQFAAVLWNHAPAMLKHAREAKVAAPTLQGDEITDVLRFLASLRYFEPSGSAFLGERVFGERGCARCHGSKAQGTREGPALRPGSDAFTTVSFATALWRHGPAMRAHAEQLGIPWPSLEATDVGDLISFLNDPAREN
jgi:cytochrome c2